MIDRARLRPQIKGQVLIGGIGTKKLRDIIGAVMQDDDLFAGMIAKKWC